MGGRRGGTRAQPGAALVTLSSCAYLTPYRPALLCPALPPPQAGADVVFIDALENAAEMEALCAVQGAHKMASMLEGGGKTPILTPAQLEGMGFKL